MRFSPEREVSGGLADTTNRTLVILRPYLDRPSGVKRFLENCHDFPFSSPANEKNLDDPRGRGVLSLYITRVRFLSRVKKAPA